MKLKPLAAALAFAAVGPAMATMCTQPSSSVVDLGPPGQVTFCNSFWSAGTFSDSFLFSVDAPASSTGWSTTWDWSWTTGIDLTKVTLTNLATGVSVTDTSPAQFGWQLTSGTYRLGVQGTVTGWPYSFPGTVGYQTTVRTAAIASAAPEPETYAMLTLGLALVGWQARRRQAKAAA